MRRRVVIAAPGAEAYGSDRQLLETMSGFVDAGWQVSLAVPEPGPLVPLARQRGVRVAVLDYPVLRRSWLTPTRLPLLGVHACAAAGRIARVLRSVTADLVFVNTTTMPWWLVAARLAKVPVICHVHEAERADSGVARALLSGPLMLADQVICNGTTARDTAVSAIPALASRVVVVPNGVPGPTPRGSGSPAAMPEATGQMADHLAEGLRLVLVGRISPRKSTHIALEALAQLRASGGEAQLSIIGSTFTGYEWYLDELRSLVKKHGLESAVTWTGFVDPIWPALGEADVLIAPSARESFGNVVVEGQLAGLPVVVAGAMGHLEIVQDGVNGRTFRPDDADDLARVLGELSADPAQRRRLAAEGQSDARQRFSTQAYQQRIVSVAAELVGDA